MRGERAGTSALCGDAEEAKALDLTRTIWYGLICSPLLPVPDSDDVAG